jgi:RNA polymerase sigma factor (TIGR02999 family)
MTLRRHGTRLPSHHVGMDHDIAGLIREADSGDRDAADRLFTAMYAELHRVAERQLLRGGPITLGATTLLHEAYISMADREGTSYPDRAHFMSYASRAMRGLVIDYVRNRRALKRGGEFHITGIDTSTPAGTDESQEHIDALGEALEGLSALDRPLAQLVDLHFFCGFGFGEIAAMRGVSERTVLRDWRKARLLLRSTLSDES